MARSRSLGLDELMIINPGPAYSGDFFLGEDGTPRQVQGLEEEFFLGDDGVLYQVRGLGLEGPGCGRCFLGEDGTLYEVVK